MVELGKAIFRCTFSVLGCLRRGWTSTRDTVEGPPKATLSRGAQDTPLACRQSGEEGKEGGEERRGEESRGEESREGGSFETIAEITYFNIM